MHTKTKLARLWANHRADIVTGACAVIIAVMAQSSELNLQGYVLDRMPGAKQSTTTIPKPLEPQRAKKRVDMDERAKRRVALRERFAALRQAMTFSRSESLGTLFSGPSDVPGGDIVVATAEPVGPFPSFERAVHPAARTPNWGAMTTPEEWNRDYIDMDSDDFTTIPSYDLQKLVIPLQTLIRPRNVTEITRKLYYSTRFFSSYNIDEGEFTGNHVGVDLKLALGQPIVAVAGGRVHDVRQDNRLGLHVIIEHHHPTDGTFFSVYAHLGSVSVTVGQDVAAGQTIGTVGLTGSTSGPHLHLQIDRATGAASHTPYSPSSMPSVTEAERHTVNPIRFIQRYAAGA